MKFKVKEINIQASRQEKQKVIRRRMKKFSNIIIRENGPSKNPNEIPLGLDFSAHQFQFEEESLSNFEALEGEENFLEIPAIFSNRRAHSSPKVNQRERMRDISDNIAQEIIIP